MKICLPFNRLQRHICTFVATVILSGVGMTECKAQDNLPPRTTLSQTEVKYSVPESGYVVLKRGPVEAVIVDNRAVDDAILPGHKAGYHGVASLRYSGGTKNVFVPNYSGLNFEHIHDGTTQPRELLYEPRQAPMQLRKINEFTVDLYQPPTPHWGLESCLRYELLDSGVIEMTFECVPRKASFANGYIGLFWASYINTPESLDIHYPGKTKGVSGDPPRWIRGVTPKHGELSTHLGDTDHRQFKHSPDFPLGLVFSESTSLYSEPWFFGKNGDTAFLQVFRRNDAIRLSQSPSGGGAGCPAWDFQWFIPDYKVGQRYQFIMQGCCLSAKGSNEIAIQDQVLNVARASQLSLGESVTEVAQKTPLRATWDRLKTGGKVICLGDSVTGVYYHTGGLRAYTDMLGHALRKAAPGSEFQMINAGISGHTTINGLERLERDVLKHRPDLVTIMFGLNDMTRVPPEQYRANLITLVRRCWGVGAEVLLCTPNNVINTGGRPVQKLEEYCQIIHDVGRTLGVAVADCYQGMEVLRKADPDSWRLLLSDEIHPNMDGHKRMAEIICKAISKVDAQLNDVEPPAPSFAGIAAAVEAKRVAKVLAMPPFDKAVEEVLRKRFPEAKFEITRWETENRTLVQLEQEAKDRVRALRPDLVIIAVPRTAKFTSREEFIRSYSWVMNWSLSFGNKEWECFVVHPAVADPEHPEPEQDALVRRLVRAQDLKLLDRNANDKRSLVEILTEIR